MSTVRPPGVYLDNDLQQRHAALALHPTGIPGFLGLTQRGPLNVPVRITNIEAFERIFGRLSLGTYLEPSLRGFFENGGRECYVLRVAHQRENGPGVAARAATADVRDPKSRRRYVVRASSEGSWGNDVRFKIDRTVARLRTVLTLDAAEGDTVLNLKSVAGLARGTALRIHDEQGETWRFVQVAAGKQVALDAPLDRVYKSSAPTTVETLEFDISVRSRDDHEVFRNLSVAPFADDYFVRAVGERSRLVRMDEQTPEVVLPDSLPAERDWQALEGGEDGLHAVTPGDFIGASAQVGVRTGLLAYEEVEQVDLLVIPDLMWCADHSEGFRTLKDVEIVQQEAISLCERLKDRFALLDIPPSQGARSAIQWRKMFDSAFAAFYYPWVAIQQGGKEVLVPPSGFVAGVVSRVDRARGVFHPPANEAIESAVDLELILHDKDLGELNREGVNCLKSFPTRGIRIWGARTASSDPMQRFVNVRREIGAIVKTLSRDLQWVVFEPNESGLWKRVAMDVQFFLYDLWKQGFFRGGSPEEAFFVKCDSENNPPEVREAGMVVIDVGVSPVRPAEFVTFTITQTADEHGPGVGV